MTQVPKAFRDPVVHIKRFQEVRNSFRKLIHYSCGIFLVLAILLGLQVGQIMQEWNPRAHIVTQGDIDRSVDALKSNLRQGYAEIRKETEWHSPDKKPSRQSKAIKGSSRKNESDS